MFLTLQKNVFSLKNEVFPSVKMLFSNRKSLNSLLLCHWAKTHLTLLVRLWNEANIMPNSKLLSRSNKIKKNKDNTWMKIIDLWFCLFQIKRKYQTKCKCKQTGQNPSVIKSFCYYFLWSAIIFTLLRASSGTVLTIYRKLLNIIFKLMAFISYIF